MNFKARFTLWVNNFFRKYGRIILIAFFVWLIIFLINKYLKENPPKQAMSNTYTPDAPVIDDTDSISKSTAQKINDTIKTYFDYCNNKDYENAFNMLTDDCKRYVYSNNIDNFQSYIDNIFTSKKVYSAQNYSNVDKVYIYTLTISDDLEASGSTGSSVTSGMIDNYQEKIAVRKVNDDYKISNDNFIETDNLGIVKSDDYMDLTVVSKDVSYSMEQYNLNIKNKTNGYILISDYSVSNEVELNIGDQLRKALNLANGQYYVGPGETKNISYIFRKYYDDGKTPTELRLNAIRILKNYTGQEEDTSTAAGDMYSMNIDLTMTEYN